MISHQSKNSRNKMSADLENRTCPYCQKILATKYTLIKHIQSWHENTHANNSHHCESEKCNFVCQYPSELKRHYEKCLHFMVHVETQELKSNFDHEIDRLKTEHENRVKEIQFEYEKRICALQTANNVLQSELSTRNASYQQLASRAVDRPTIIRQDDLLKHFNPY
jgi:hypothetical protein